MKSTLIFFAVLAVITALAIMFFGCSEMSYYAMGYNDGLNAALSGINTYNKPSYGKENISEYRRGYFQGYADGAKQLFGVY